MSATQRLDLPLLIAGQSLREQTLNEALRRIDICLAAAVEGDPSNTPPISPVAGECHLVGPSPVGDWVGQADCLAGYDTGGWRFVAPVSGMRVHDLSDGLDWEYGSGGWNKVAVAAISDPSGGSVVDLEARTSLSLILSALRDHGLIAG